jgi:TPR repeat protein
MYLNSFTEKQRRIILSSYVAFVFLSSLFTINLSVGGGDDVLQWLIWVSLNALFWLGVRLTNWIRTNAYSQATNWHRKAAEKGLASAQLNLGTAYWKGESVPQDYSQAASWFRKAAEQGNAEAQAKLGSSYAKGYGVPEDLVLAYAWLNLAASQGEGNASSSRDLAAEQLPPSQLAEAQRLSSYWRKGQSIQREKQQ